MKWMYDLSFIKYYPIFKMLKKCYVLKLVNYSGIHLFCFIYAKVYFSKLITLGKQHYVYFCFKLKKKIKWISNNEPLIISVLNYTFRIEYKMYIMLTYFVNFNLRKSFFST